MSNTGVALKCTVAQQDRPEGVLLKRDNTWSSPDGGWLIVQSGRWSQGAEGCYLQDDAKQKLGTLLGLVFLTASEGGSGRFNYDAGGDAGNWTVTGTAE